MSRTVDMSRRVARFVREQVGVYYEIDTGSEPKISQIEGNTVVEMLFEAQDCPALKMIVVVEPDGSMPPLGHGASSSHEYEVAESFFKEDFREQVIDGG